MDYVFVPFSSFLSSYRILHHCSHTPQLNGAIDQKNRHLVETTYTLLLHHHVPHCFFGDDILTTCYLINCMSSSLLHYQISRPLLLSSQPLFYLPPSIFGCTFFAHILTSRQDKLSAQATKCVFLGYSWLQYINAIFLIHINTFSL